MKKILVATALLVASLPGASAQQAGVAQSGKTPFCSTAEDYYNKLLNLPMHNEKQTQTNVMTFTIYRNAAAERILTMAWAGRCDLTPFLRSDMNHYNQVVGTQIGAQH